MTKAGGRHNQVTLLALGYAFAGPGAFPMFHTSDALIRNVHSQVADRVGMSIVRGDVGVGETLPSEMQICEMMDVSRTVVREAIRTLTGKGLVEARPKSGTRVRPPEQWNQLDPDVLRWRLETSDMTAEEGERWGFFSRIVAPDQVLAQAQTLAKQVSEGPTFANTMKVKSASGLADEILVSSTWKSVVFSGR